MKVFFYFRTVRTSDNEIYDGTHEWKPIQTIAIIVIIKSYGIINAIVIAIGECSK